MKYPDELLEASQFDQLNAEFYADVDPSDFFDWRLRLLMSGTATVQADEVGVGRFKLPARPVNVDVDLLATLEAFNVLHHVAECAWMLFLAHESPGPCARLAMARIRYGDLQNEIRLFRQQAETDRVGRVRAALHIDDAAGIIDDEGMLDERILGGAELLRCLGTQLLERAWLYNATKHGFGVGAQRAQLTIDLPPEAGMILPPRTATWLNNLEVLDRTQNRRRWAVAHSAVELDRMFAAIGLATQLVRSLWATGRAAFGAVPPDGEPVHVGLPTSDEVHEVMYEVGTQLERYFVELKYSDGDQQIVTDFRRFPREESNAGQ